MGLLDMAISIIAGNITDKAADAQKAAIEKQRLMAQVPDSAKKGAWVMEELSRGGLANYYSRMNEIKSRLPSNMEAMRRAANSGSFTQAIVDLNTNQNQLLNDFSNADAEKRNQNQKDYAQYLGGVLAPYEQDTQRTKRDLALMSSKVDWQASKDKLDYAQYGAQSIDPATQVSSLLGSGDFSSLISGAFGKKELTEEEAAAQHAKDVEEERLVAEAKVRELERKQARKEAKRAKKDLSYNDGSASQDEGTAKDDNPTIEEGFDSTIGNLFGGGGGGGLLGSVLGMFA